MEFLQVYCNVAVMMDQTYCVMLCYMKNNIFYVIFEVYLETKISMESRFNNLTNLV